MANTIYDFAPIESGRLSTYFLTSSLGRRIKRISCAIAADSFLVSYPKSGRTWLRFILANYFVLGSVFQERVDLSNMFSFVPNFDFDPIRGVPAFRTRAHSARIPLILATHQPYATAIFLRKPIIFMVRDPRDLMVSAYFHAQRQKHRFAGSLEEFLTHRDLGLPAFIKYLNGWAERLKYHRHIIVSYEQLSSNSEFSIARILEFLECPLNACRLVAALDCSSFDKMQAQERRDGIPGHHYDRGDTEALRMRKGKVGGFSNYLSPSLIDFVESTCHRDLNIHAQELLVCTGWQVNRLR